MSSTVSKENKMGVMPVPKLLISMFYPPLCNKKEPIKVLIYL